MRVYHDSDGRVLFTFSGPDAIAPAGDFIEADDQPLVPAEWKVVEGELVEIPGAAIQAARASASLTKPEFILACMSVGILTPEEATQAAHGNIPEPFQQVVDNLPPYEQAILNVVWPTATQIDRLDPLILALADGLGIGDHTLDALFGLVEYQL